jgi:manganese oxidase
VRGTSHPGFPLASIAAFVALLTIAGGATGAPGASAAMGTMLTYYIAADPIHWNYAPTGRNLITGRPFGPEEGTFVKGAPNRVGRVYWKGLYRLYTDGTFKHRKSQGPRWGHLGMLGPVIHAEVGDTIKVVFLNRLPFPASIHPHGVFYSKRAEGSPYPDGTRGRGDIVAPGRRYTYIWKVPARAGPASMDGSSVLWMYHSHVDEVRDTNTGLVGPIIVTKRGMARPDGSPKDVDREFVNLFSVMNENESHFLPRNVHDFTRLRGRAASEEALEHDEDFGESNLMHSINGYVYGSLPGLDMKRGEDVRWYMLDLGTEVDLHTPHWHGNTITFNGMRTDMLQLLPGMMSAADMTPDDAGTWLLHCHVNDHILAGMLALYHVS